MNIGACTKLLGLLALVLLLPGCVKYFDVSKSEFPQGSLVEQQHKLTRNYVRSNRLYNEFSTVALFDFLWLSPEVRTYFAHRYSAKRGKDDETRKALETKQLEENNHWIGFYVLADIRTRHNVLLNEKNAAWTFYLTINNNIKVEPSSIKEAELAPEYQALFGRRFNSFKTVYLIKFPAYGLDGKPYITTDKPTLSLAMCGPSQEDTAHWHANNTNQSNVVHDEDLYWV